MCVTQVSLSAQSPHTPELISSCRSCYGAMTLLISIIYHYWHFPFLHLPLSPFLQNIQHRKYARWKATYIHNCLKSGETPQAGPIGMEGEVYGEFWYNISTSFHKQPNVSYKENTHRPEAFLTLRQKRLAHCARYQIVRGPQERPCGHQHATSSAQDFLWKVAVMICWRAWADDPSCAICQYVNCIMCIV